MLRREQTLDVDGDKLEQRPEGLDVIGLHGTTNVVFVVPMGPSKLYELKIERQFV